MNSSDKIFRFANDIYTNNVNMLAIYNTQMQELNNCEDVLYRNFLNNLVKYANLEGIRRFEAIFYIVADELNESIDFRRARIIQKLTTLPPFTRIFLEQMFKNLFGKDMFVIKIIYNEYRLQIDVQTSISGLFEQTMKDVREIIPANIILEKFIILPYTHRYLRDYYTQRELEQFDYRELSRYAE